MIARWSLLSTPMPAQTTTCDRPSRSVTDPPTPTVTPLEARTGDPSAEVSRQENSGDFET
jgi:hypothetical protein